MVGVRRWRELVADKKRWKEEVVKRSSNAGSEKMERVGGRKEKMEGHCSTGQSPQWAVVLMEEEREDPGKDGKRKQKEIFKCWE